MITVDDNLKFLYSIFRRDNKNITLKGTALPYVKYPEYYSDYGSIHLYVLSCSDYLRTGVIHTELDLHADKDPDFTKSGYFTYIPNPMDIIVVLSRRKREISVYAYMWDGNYKLNLYKNGQPLLLREDTPFYKDFLLALQECRDHFTNVFERTNNSQKLYLEDGINPQGFIFFGNDVERIAIKGDLTYLVAENNYFTTGLIRNNKEVILPEELRHCNVETNDLIYNLVRYKTFIRVTIGRLIHKNLERVLQVDVDKYSGTLQLENCLMSIEERQIISSAFSVLWTTYISEESNE